MRVEGDDERTPVDGDAEPRVVVVKAVIERAGRYLLARHNKRSLTKRAQWSFPGGRIEPADGSAGAALLRELREELAVDARVRDRLGVFTFKSRQVVVLLAEIDGEPRPDVEEVLATRWFSPAEVEGLNQAGLLRMGFEGAAIARAAGRGRAAGLG